GGAAPRRARRAEPRHDAGAVHRLRGRAGQGVVSAGQGLGRQAELTENRDRPRFSMPGISIHVVDVSRGIVAAGMRVELRHEGQLIAGGKTSDKGTLDVGQRVAPGFYEAVFHVADWYRAQRVDLPKVPFLDVITYRFGVSNPDQ